MKRSDNFEVLPEPAVTAEAIIAPLLDAVFAIVFPR